MDLATEKINLIEWLVNIKNENIIHLLLTIKNKENTTGNKAVDLSSLQSKLLKMPVLEVADEERFVENRTKLNNSLKR